MGARARQRLPRPDGGVGEAERAARSCLSRRDHAVPPPRRLPADDEGHRARVVGAAASRQLTRPARAFAVSTRMTAAFTTDANDVLVFNRAAIADDIGPTAPLFVTSTTSTPAARA